MIRKMLEAEHSKAQCNRIVSHVGTDPTKFAELIEEFLTGPYRITQCAAWPISYIVIAHPGLVSPHLGKLIKLLGTPGIHDAVKRNILRFLPSVTIPASQREKLIELCFGFLANRSEPVAVHVFAMEVLARLVEPYPELRRELSLILEEQLPYASPGYRSRATKILKKVGVNR
jgi:hypothetical protein